jgi:hypothetical protein
MAALLLSGRLGKPVEESVGDDARLEQIAQGAKRVRGTANICRWRSRHLPSRIPIGPGGRNQRAGAVGQRYEQQQNAASSNATDDGQGMAFESMALPRDKYCVRDIAVMGSLWPLPSTGSIMTFSWTAFSNGSQTPE